MERLVQVTFSDVAEALENERTLGCGLLRTRQLGSRTTLSDAGRE
jgi:hypothetical protein